MLQTEKLIKKIRCNEQKTEGCLKKQETRERTLKSLKDEYRDMENKLCHKGEIFANKMQFDENLDIL